MIDLEIRSTTSKIIIKRKSTSGSTIYQEISHRTWASWYDLNYTNFKIVFTQKFGYKENTTANQRLQINRKIKQTNTNTEK